MTLSGFELGERVRVDWWRVVSDIEQTGMPQARIAKHLGRSFGWVDYVKNSPGASPKWEDGDRLLQLWLHCTGGLQTAAPREHSGISSRTR